MCVCVPCICISLSNAYIQSEVIYIRRGEEEGKRERSLGHKIESGIKLIEKVL